MSTEKTEKGIPEKITFRPNESYRAHLKQFMGIHRIENVTEAIHGMDAEYQVLKEQQRAGLIREQKEEDIQREELGRFQELGVECTFLKLVEGRPVCFRAVPYIQRLGLEKPKRPIAEFCVRCLEQEQKHEEATKEARELRKVEKPSNLVVWDKKIEYERLKNLRQKDRIMHEVCERNERKRNREYSYRGPKVNYPGV